MPIGADPAHFFVPPDLGSKGWIGMWLVPLPDRDEVAILVRRNYRIVAPKRLGISSDR